MPHLYLRPAFAPFGASDSGFTIRQCAPYKFAYCIVLYCIVIWPKSNYIQRHWADFAGRSWFTWVNCVYFGCVHSVIVYWVLLKTVHKFFFQCWQTLFFRFLQDTLCFRIHYFENNLPKISISNSHWLPLGGGVNPGKEWLKSPTPLVEIWQIQLWEYGSGVRIRIRTPGMDSRSKLPPKFYGDFLVHGYECDKIFMKIRSVSPQKWAKLWKCLISQCWRIL